MPDARRPAVIPLSAVEPGDETVVGAKAFRLGRLLRDGLPVPPGFCVPADASTAHLEAAGLGPRLAEVDRLADPAAPDARAALARLRAAIVAAPLDAALVTAIAEAVTGLDAGPLAVRSSATGEDAPGQSFAGQHDTFLEVVGADACAARVRDCWASLLSDRAVAYRARHGISNRDAAMAVLVQRLVPADAAGVLFTADPRSGRRDVLVIEGAAGAGEAVVSGRVAPARLVVGRARLDVREQSGDPGPAGLAPPAVARLAAHADAAERRLEGPLDLEWARADGTVWLLQARPVTGLPSASVEDRQVWTNANAGEVLPDVITPMTESVVMPLVTELFDAVGGWLGVHLGTATLLRCIAGRVYFNVNTLLGLVRGMPMAGDRDLGEMLGGRHDLAEQLGCLRIPDEDIPELTVGRLRTMAGLPRLPLAFLTHSPRRAAAITHSIRTRTARLATADLDGLDDATLARAVHGAVRDRLLGHDAILCLGVGIACSLALYGVCRRWLGADGQATANELLRGMGSLEHAEAGLALWRLAEQVGADAALAGAVREAAGFDDLRRRLADVPAGAAFLAAWAAFARAHGHHARGEIELGNARWAERPDEVLALLRSCLEGVGRHDPVARARRLRAERRTLAAACRRRLRGPFRRRCFDAALRLAIRGTPVRENLKNEVVRRMAVTRMLLLALGGRWSRRGGLEVAEDVFMLRLEELPAMAADPGRADLAAAVAERRRAHARHLALEPPPVIVGRFDPAVAPPPEAIDPATRRLTGLGVCPGVAVGPARVIDHCGDDHVRPGEILVAPFTDPGWTPYFLNAAGIVMDMGGLLSHGSIVAREYGIPCVANVGPATKIVRTGRTIRVDGTAGTVELLDEDAAAD
ncbi:MAG: PEP/pyruvate-binding domain-containing protein [Planctomycetota bacterium]|jgi:pyruvate,water dikinase